MSQPLRPKGVEDDNLGDWRIRAATTLAADLPATATGAPAHKAGARVVQSTSTKAPNGEHVGFVTPSASALQLGLAVKAVEQAETVRSHLRFDDAITPEGPGKSIREEADLFDYFAHCMVVTTFSFQALEAYCNQVIADSMKSAVRLERRREGKKQFISFATAADVERFATTEEKLAVILPQILGLASPKGKAVWANLVKLKRARDATAHLKAIDQYPHGVDKGFIDESSLFYKFLYEDLSQYPRAAVAMMTYFARRTDIPRWLQHLQLLYDIA